MIDKFKEPINFDLIDEFLVDSAKNDEYMEIVKKFFSENMHLGETEIGVHTDIKVPITKWLYNYIDVGIYDSFNQITRSIDD